MSEYPVSFKVRVVSSDPSPMQIDTVSEYVKQRIMLWDSARYPLPETHVVDGVHIVVERKPEETGWQPERSMSDRIHGLCNWIGRRL